MTTDANDGRGFPLADEAGEAPVATAPHRILLVELIQSALRSEAGVRRRQANHQKTDYYAGRRAGFVSAAARLMAVSYGGDPDVAQVALASAVRLSGEGFTQNDLMEDLTSEAMARGIAEETLKII